MAMRQTDGFVAYADLVKETDDRGKEIEMTGSGGLRVCSDDEESVRWHREKTVTWVLLFTIRATSPTTMMTCKKKRK